MRKNGFLQIPVSAFFVLSEFILKKTINLALIFLLIPILSVANAQTVVHVDPGYGSLNDSVANHPEPATYILKAGGWYGLNETLEIDTPIAIIGEPTTSGQMPAMLQTGFTSDGTTFSRMFTTYSDLTLKHLFIVNADLNDGYGAGIMYNNGAGRIVMDSLVIDPVGNHYFMETYNTTHYDIFLTNSLLMRKGHTLAVSDGYFFDTNPAAGWDTLYVENNTFVDPGGQVFKGPNAETDHEGFTWMNHNTWLFGKSTFKGMFGDSDMYVTNNLMFMQDFVPIRVQTGHPDSYENNKWHGLMREDTLLTETLPSTRKNFVEYNSNYRVQGIWDMVSFVNNQTWGVNSYLYNFVPPIQYIDSSEDTRIYNDKTDFPYFFVDNNITDTSAEIKDNDPQFVDSKIYDLADSAIVWTDSLVYQIYGGLPANSALWPDFFYNADTSVGNPTTWPRFNGAYTNQKIMTASIAGLPLGDLNWFPDQKKQWMDNEKDITQHILSEDESQMTLTDVKQANIQSPTKFSLSQNYPNPFNPTTEINYSIVKNGLVTLKVYNMLGQEVATLVNQQQNKGSYTVHFDASRFASGVYFYSLRQEGNSITKKMILLK